MLGMGALYAGPVIKTSITRKVLSAIMTDYRISRRQMIQYNNRT